MYSTQTAYGRKNGGEPSQTARWKPHQYEGHRSDVPQWILWGSM